MDHQALVLLISDSPIHLAGLKTILREAGFEQLHSAESVSAAVELAKDQQPGLIALHSLDAQESFRAIDELHRVLPEFLLFVVAHRPDQRYAKKLQKQGVQGCICLTATGDTLLAAVNRVMAGERVFIVNTGDHLENVTSANSVDGNDLSERELQVLSMLGDGKDNKEITHALGISISSVETYRDRLKRKLGISNTRELVRYAIMWRLRQT